uniref:Uncharacterized protein n=1 Tax=Glossina palpalis gambiensis TaxID=67801 RepID=A0A1B0ALC5_9MUSC
MSAEQVLAASNSTEGAIVADRISNYEGFAISLWGRFPVLVYLNHVVHGRSVPVGKITMERPLCGTYFCNFWFRYEIVCEEKPFLSTSEKWGVNEEIDKRYWGKFKAFKEYVNTFNLAEFDYTALAESKHVFMRWQRDALINHMADLENSPFSRFYYVCLTKTTGDIEAYYYDENSALHHTIDVKLIS